MTSDRPYRRARSTDAALDELQCHAGTQFDPRLVVVALNAREQLEAARAEMANGTKSDYFTAF